MSPQILYCHPHKELTKRSKFQAHHEMLDQNFGHLRRDFLSKNNWFFCGRAAEIGKKRKHDVLEVKTIGKNVRKIF